MITPDDWVILKNFLNKKIYERGINSLQVWLPISDEETEGVWKDYNGSVIRNYTLPWIGLGPDGGVGQNCARVVDENGWGDHRCDLSKYACMCSYKPNFYLKLRGLPLSSEIDIFYKPINNWEDGGILTLQGLTRTSITYNETKKRWNLDVAHSSLSATLKAAHASFTLGKHTWMIRGDNDLNEGNEYLMELKMSGCQEGEFTCNSGQCVSMDKRCNQLPDCRDDSDEKSCQILVLKEGYNMRVPPIKADQKPVDVSVSMDLLKLVDINEEDYSIEIQFEIQMKWKENRATYQNLKDKDSLNALPKKDFEMLWLPRVVYENTDQKDLTRLGSNWEWETKIIVEKEGNSTSSGNHVLDETEIFKGSENSLVMSQTYTRTFQCLYKLSAYPFDTQVSHSSPIIFEFLFRHAPSTWP